VLHPPSFNLWMVPLPLLFPLCPSNSPCYSGGFSHSPTPLHSTASPLASSRWRACTPFMCSPQSKWCLGEVLFSLNILLDGLSRRIQHSSSDSAPRSSAPASPATPSPLLSVLTIRCSHPSSFDRVFLSLIIFSPLGL